MIPRWPGQDASRSAGGLSRLPLTPSRHGKGDQENHDCDATDDVRHQGNEPGNVARVSPDEADKDSRDDHGDRRSQPVENPSSGDDVEPTLVGALRQSIRQTLLVAKPS